MFSTLYPLVSRAASTMLALVRAPDFGMMGPPFVRRLQTNGKGLICQLKYKLSGMNSGYHKAAELE